MVASFAKKDAELLGIAPLVVPIATAAVTIGTTIAGLVAAKRQQKRATGAQTSQQAHELKMAELAAKQKAASDKKTLETAAIVGIPAAALMFLL